MACIKSASRSALVAFSPQSPYLACGTMAGAVDLSFSSLASLEIFHLDFQSDGTDLLSVAECPSGERFNRLSWSKSGSAASEKFSLGLIAGGLVDGSISIWNPISLIRSKDIDGSLIGRLSKHAGPVRGLEFNVNLPNQLASGADEGEIYIWDLSNPAEPTHFPALKGTGVQGEVSFLSWNHKVHHILASTSYSGTTMVWDLKRQKPVISFTESNKRRCSVLQWNPDVATQLIVASDDDNSPSLRLWDVRNTISPLKEFFGHSKGVIAMEWCPNDSSFLLTCAKDNRSICWDTLTGEIVCELPASTNWNFDVHWYPKTPGVISASSFDGISIYNIEAFNRAASEDGDFTGTSGSSVHLRAPKWLKRSIGVSFGFGGRLVSFRPSSSLGGASPGNSEVYLHNLVTELNLVNHSSEFESAILNGERASLRRLCDRKSQESESEDDKETWGFLKVMCEDDGTARTKLLAHLGFTVHTERNENVCDELGQEITDTPRLDETTASKMGTIEGSEFGEYPIDNGEEFFNNLRTPKADPSLSFSHFRVESGVITNGEQVLQEVEVLGEMSDSSFDEGIHRALVVGDYKEAVLQCISANRMADALVIAHVGGSALWESTLDQYLKKSHSSYLRVVSAITKNDLMSIVKTRPLYTWKETLALLCTFAQKEEWSVLCETLASRLMVVGNTLAATLCYICAGNIDQTIEIWSRSLESEHGGKTHVDLLQGLMEKTIILALATGQKHFGASVTKLVENYAELLANQGLLTTAMEYLKLLESEEFSHELSILRDRIAFSVEEKEAPKELHLENSQPQAKPIYGGGISSVGIADGSQHYYQELKPQQQQPVPSNPYGEAYQPFSAASYSGGPGGYQPIQQNQKYEEYVTPAPFQPTGFPQMFLPSQTPQVPQTNFAPSPTATQSGARTFVPTTPPVLKNVEQYQPPTLGSQLYPGISTPTHQAGPPGSASHSTVPSQAGLVPGHNLPQVVAPNSTFSTQPGFLHNPSMGTMKPPSPTNSAQPQSMVTPAPSPTMQTVDTSEVPAELRPVITTLTRLYNETSEALGGSHANPAKKREIDDNSKKIGSLFAKLNGGDISPNAANKLRQLCQALDSGDFAAALHIQVGLTTSDWDECNFWLAALKRMIKTRQSMR